MKITTRKAAAALIPLLLLFLSGTASAAAVDSILETGERHMRHRDFPSAQAEFDKAVKESPGNLYAHIGRQEASRRSGTTADLFSEYKARWERTPKDPIAAYLYARLLLPVPSLKALDAVSKPDFFVHLERAKALKKLGKSEAKSEIAEADEKCPKDARAKALLAGYYEDVGDFPKALMYFEEAEKLAPKRIEAIVGRANVQRLMGTLDPALASLRQLADKERDDPEIAYRVGLVYFDQGEHDLAIRSFDGALASARDDVDVLLASGEAFMAKEKYGNAEQRFNKATEKGPNRVDAFRRLGYCQEVQDKNDEALEAFRKITQIDPINSSDAYTAIGWVYIKKGKYDEAMQAFRQAADMNAEEITALFFVGFTYDLQGRWSEAVDAYEKAIKADPEYARAYNNIGLDYDLLGKASKALKFMKKAVELDPKNVEFALNLGSAYYSAKKYKDAVAAFEAAAANDPTALQAWTGLARSQGQARRYKKAAAAYEKAIELDDKAPDLHLVVGIIYQQNLKKYTEALTHYEQYILLGGDDPVVEKWMEDCRKRG